MHGHWETICGSWHSSSIVLVQELNSGFQTLWQAPPLTELSHQPSHSNFISSFLKQMPITEPFTHQVNSRSLVTKSLSH